MDELVFKLADLFERKAFAELLRLILDLVQEILLYRILNGKIDAMKCCTTGHFLLNGTFKRQFRTSLGEFTMKLWQVKCTSCGKTFSPLQRFLKLKPYQTKTNELEKMVAEAVSAETCRRAHQEMKSLGKTAVPVSTMNRWVMKTDCDEIEISRNVIGSMPVQIMPDGTKFKGPGENGEAHRKKDIEARMQAAELAVAQLISYIDSCGYSTAANYLRRVQFGMFGYVHRWLKLGLISPRASSMIERVMRELARRIKKIAYGWSEKGVMKIARIILKRFANPEEREEYWKKRMDIIGNVYIRVGEYTCSSQELVH